MPKSGMFGSSTLGDLIAQALHPTTQADVNAAFGVRPGKPRYTLSRPQPFKPASGNEAHWRKRLANQGQITATKPTISEKVESSLGDILGKALSDNYARHVAKRAMAPINDWTPVGNVTGMEEGAKTAYHGLTRGDLASGALGAGVFALNAIPFGGSVKRQGENALMALMRDESGAIRAWHGSPHDFDRFDMSKIGTGEGAQAYGHGLYFAENRGVAENYRDDLSKQVTVGGSRLDTHPMDDALATAQHAVAGRVGNGMKPADAINQEIEGWQDYAARFRRSAEHDPKLAALAAERAASFERVVEHLRRLDPQAFVKNPGRLYEVNINAEPEDFLDWDAPLGNHPALNAVNSKYGWTAQLGDFPLGVGHFGDAEYALERARNYPGRGVMGAGVNSAAFAPEGTSAVARSQALKAAGIPGIRYLDQGSRGGSSGTHNYVVFDDSLIDILNKF